MFPGNLYEQAEAFLRSFKGAFTQAACRAVVPTPDRQKETSPCARFAAAHCHDGKGVLFLYGGATSRSVEQTAGEGLRLADGPAPVPETFLADLWRLDCSAGEEHIQWQLLHEEEAGVLQQSQRKKSSY